VTVYLLHFVDPATGAAARYKHAGHYTGSVRSSGSLKARLDAHRMGRGARLMAVIAAAGLGFELARTWPGGRARERQLKRQGGASRHCPLCGIKPMAPRRPRPAAPVTADARPACVTGGLAALAELARREHRAAVRKITETARTVTPPPGGFPPWHPWHAVVGSTP
jgi:hypothetical protein